ncbi:MAG: PD-(D/E)XK nuclease family protein, partial [Candidatus Nanopelagicales bacterium]|nr:PD-(D/E)XK nuclease family protein [Candidatus Nanopelagicales bacterium]
WSTSSAMALVSDPSEFAARVRRPIPSPVSRGAQEGTEFHLWVQEYYGQPSLFDGFDEFPDADDVGGPGIGPANSDIAELRQRFVACGYADRRPVAIEWPFSIVIGARVLTGQIDAVFASADGGWEVVDWKTNARPDADPFQLAVYRVAWSRIKQVPPERITGAFAYVRLGQVVRFPDLADEQQLAARIEKACALADESAGSGAIPTTSG